MQVYRSRGYTAFTIANYLFCSLMAVLCVLPIIHILAVSFSGKAPANAHLVNLWPVDFTSDAFMETLTNKNFIRSMGISVIRTISGSALFLVMSTMTAYPLSKQEGNFRGRSIYTWYFVFTMLFGGGLVPFYILMQQLHLNNTMWVLILPGAVDIWSVIMLLNFFKGVPREMEEAALIDGASHFSTLFRIYLPLSLPVLATVTLFKMVGHWNSWFDGLIYLTDRSKYPLATLLQTIVIQEVTDLLDIDPAAMSNVSNRTIKCAQLFIATLPILCVYPFLQRYFTKGIVLGAVKG